MNKAVAAIENVVEAWQAEEVLTWAFDQFSPHFAIASAFGAEGIVLIDLASKIRRDFRVFTLDTGFLFPETYKLLEQVEQRYGIQVERVRSLLTPEIQETTQGPALWKSNPDLCCHIRKVEPLEHKLAELQGWASAIRRDQTRARSAAQKVEWDEKFGIVKVNPLADWTSDEVWTYILKHRLNYNPLHDRGYPSIGCTHCTRAVRPGEDPRAGRWAGMEKTECGLHQRREMPVQILPATQFEQAQ